MLFELQKYFPKFGDVFQHEDGVTIGYTRQELEVTGEAGGKLYIGDFIVMESPASRTGTIPKTIQEIKDAKWLGIYAGNDPYHQMNTKNPTYNQNVSYFNADTLTQKIIVISRGRIGVAEGGSAGTTKHDSGLRFPATTSKADKQAVWDKLIEQGFKVLRQVP
mgnify:CR=1 FL=1